MDVTVVIGTATVFLCVCLVLAAYVWSARIIDRISRDDLSSLRQIKRELSNGGKHD